MNSRPETQQEPLYEVESESGNSNITVVDVVDDDEAVGHGLIDLDDDEWHTTHVSLEKLQLAIEAARTHEDATHTQFHVNENGLVVFQSGFRGGVLLMPMVSPEKLDDEFDGTEVDG